MQPGDIVVLKTNYNAWSHAGDVGVVTQLSYPGLDDTLVTWRVLLRPAPHDICCYAFRLEKIGEVPMRGFAHADTSAD